jgi:hypothetical protein
MRTIEDYDKPRFSVLLADMETVLRAVRGTDAAHPESTGLEVTEGEADLGRVYVGKPQSGGSRPATALVFSPRGREDVTVVFSDLTDGWITLTYWMTKHAPCQAWVFRAARPTVEWPLLGYEHIDSGESKRVVQLIRDDPRWEFYQRGHPVPEEDTSRFTAKPKKARLRYEDVLDLAERLGYPVRSPAFWTSSKPGVFIRQLWKS